MNVFGRHGVTLLEIMLVLCLLVILSAVAWPALERPLANQRLREAADAVRIQWTRARIDAMSSGRTSLFSYTPNTGTYRLESRENAEYVAEGPTDEAAAPREYTLPEGCKFIAGQAPRDDRATGFLNQDSSSDTETAASGPILFHSDGTTSDAIVTLENEHGRRIELTLRGLTGVVTVGDWYVPHAEP
jgi:prepilin-type N-terminal cleavage/methylation domain-containing protein